MSRLVIKFGGTSVGSAQAIRQAATIASDLHAAGHAVVVVTSAMSGVTDLLLAGAHAASRAELGKFLELASSIRAQAPRRPPLPSSQTRRACATGPWAPSSSASTSCRAWPRPSPCSAKRRPGRWMPSPRSASA